MSDNSQHQEEDSKIEYSQCSFDDPVWSILPSYTMFTETVNKNLHVIDPLNNSADGYRFDLPSYELSSTQANLGFAAPNQPRPYQLNRPSSPSLLSSLSNDSSTSSSHGDSIMSTHGRGSGSGSGSNSTINQVIVADETTCDWQETILDNIHKMKNMTFSTNPIANNIDIKVHFTKDVGVIGKKPVEIDPSLYEYKQGDYINGYVLIKSSNDKPIFFEMFYLLFEGTFIVQDPNLTFKHAVKVKKFLEMFDFSGSWNEAHINRLVTDNHNIYDCPLLEDPVDGSNLSFSPDKIIKPNNLYKRFFTFKIPNNLLDTECNDHNLSGHTQLPPTIGLSNYEKRLYPINATVKIKDFSMIDTSISYGVLARFIGRRSIYDVKDSQFEDKVDTRLINSTGDEYVILKESSSFVRILQQSRRYNTVNERSLKFTEDKIMYDNFLSRIKDKIELGDQLVEALQNDQLDSSIEISKRISETELEFAKAKQKYVQGFHRDIKQTYESCKKCESYEIFQPLYKKSSLISSKKVMGTLQLSTPKQEFAVTYIPPPKFRKFSPITQEDLNTWHLEIPIDLSITFPTAPDSVKKLPDIKMLQAELVVLTIKSEKSAIPIEFNHDLIFNKTELNPKAPFIDEDTFTNNVIKPLQKSSTRLYNLIMTLGVDNFRIEKQLIDDIKAVCQLNEKYINLDIHDTKIIDRTNTKSPGKDNTNPSLISWKQDNDTSFSKSFTLKLNLETCRLKTPDSKKDVGVKAYDEFHLVPNFQYCYMARLYYIKVTLVLSNGDYVRVKIPVSIQK
ncbi:Bul1 N terminus-domain-containing protein [Scheffersomyces amazonensis]|uniref:Bul1 N terminus-domain-containing protein n=1 Tax=Scheffersomyces amazonensis TaxID=1078765 RepID=UPI00315C8837